LQLGKSGKTREDLCMDEEVLGEFRMVLVKHGTEQRLVKFEIPQAVFLVAEPWTPESGLITAAMKLKRKSLEAAFASEISNMYDRNNNLGINKA